MELKDFLDIAFLIIIVNEESQQLQSDKGNVNNSDEDRENSTGQSGYLKWTVEEEDDK